MADIYGRLSSYQDLTRMRIRYSSDGQWVEETADLTICFQRPNRIRLEARRSEGCVYLVSNGTSFLARIADSVTNDFGHQFVRRPAPNPLTIASLYQATEYTDVTRPGEMYSALMVLPVPLPVSQLAFLLEDNSIETLLDSALGIRKLSDQGIRGRMCTRVRVSTAQGAFVFWIDSARGWLRRVEYPTGSDGQANSGALLTAEYRDIQTRPVINDDVFDLQAPPGGPTLRHFVLPPGDETVPQLGQTCDSFWFTDLAGVCRNAAEWREKLLLLVWFNNHPASRAVLDELKTVHQKYAGDDRIQLIAVCSEPSTAMSHADVARLTKGWSVEMLTVRDLEAFGRDLLQVDRAPTLVMLAPDGTVQLYEVGGNSEWDTQIPVVIDKVLAGERPAEQFADHIAARQRDYERAIAEATAE